jgi:ABC-type Fe3+-hydroxamate transport system substrate-binding protein
LVGRTRYCVEPAVPLAGVPTVGGTKNPNRDAIARLEPELVLGNAEENRPEDLAWLADRMPVLVQTPTTVPTAVAALEELARVLAAETEFAAWHAEFAAAGAGAAAHPRPLRAFYAIWQKPWMTVSQGTYIHDVMQTVGLHNVVAGAPSRYPAMSPAEAVALGVEVVLLASEPWPFDAAQRDAIAHAGEFGPARVVWCDGRDFCWHGVHLATGLRRARQLVAALR